MASFALGGCVHWVRECRGSYSPIVDTVLVLTPPGSGGKARMHTIYWGRGLGKVRQGRWKSQERKC